MQVFKKIKDLKMDESYTFPDGSQVHARDVLGPTVPGRKVVFMGDTCSGRSLLPYSFIIISFASSPKYLVELSDLGLYVHVVAKTTLHFIRSY